MKTQDLVTLRTFNTPMDAELAKSALDAEHIQSMIASDDARGLEPGLSLTNGVRLIVRTEDSARANRILNAADRT